MFGKIKNILFRKCLKSGTGRFSFGTVKFAFLSVMALGTWHLALSNTLPAGTKSSSVVGVEVQNIAREDNNIVVDMLVDLNLVKMSGNVETVYTPMFVNGADTVKLTPFTIAGRNRRYWDDRNDVLSPTTFYKKKLLTPDKTVVNYESKDICINPVTHNGAEAMTTLYRITESTPYKDWMENATFSIEPVNVGCANCVTGVLPIYPLAQTDFTEKIFAPEFIYITPVAEAVKMREISARAYIDFVVNRIEINPTYRNNPVELAKIQATIDSVKNDPDIKITSLHINGTASPEGNYNNNIRLAKGRTEALKNYVQSLYQFPKGFITTSFEPVDWQGLSDFLKMVVNKGIEVADVQYRPDQSAKMDSIRYDQFQNISFDLNTINKILPHAKEILGIVDSNIEPYARNRKIQTTYPAEYDWLLKNVYPALRHSDYRIQFEIKTYTDVAEIIEVMKTRPQNLSLSELFLAANSLQPGSELYNRAFELAVSMYPDDQTANLNAAVAALQNGDLKKAENYLAKADQNAPEVQYTKAVLVLLQGDQENALKQFKGLSNSSNKAVADKAKNAVIGIEEVIKKNGQNWIPLP